MAGFAIRSLSNATVAIAVPSFQRVGIAQHALILLSNGNLENVIWQLTSRLTPVLQRQN
jgi:hypothetical protein